MTDSIFADSIESPVQDLSEVAIVAKHLAFARKYTLSLLEDLDEDDWFRQPEGVTHIAWQVGHIAVSQYGLALFRQRGRAEVDLELMPSSFRKKFSRGTTPDPNPDKNPAPSEIRQTLDRVYEQVQQEIQDFAIDNLNQAVDAPYAVFSTNFGALLFAVDHELIHAGQIGLIRRFIGKSPIR